MPIIISCDNKGCFKSQEALLDVKTNEVVCVECGKNINNISIFTKRTLKDSGQIKKDAPNNKAYGVKCNKCEKTTTPILTPNKKIVCSTCSEELELSTPYKTMLLQTLTVSK